MAHNEPDERERRRHEGPLNTFTLASILLWVGVVLLLDRLQVPQRLNLEWKTWAIIVAGIGVIFLIQALVRRLTPSKGRHTLGSLIIGIILLAIGIGNAAGWEITLPVALIVAGLSIFFSRLFRR